MSETDALRARVKELELLVGISNDETLNVFRLPPSMRKLLGMLMAHEYVTADVINADINSDAKVAVHRLRSALKPWGIEVKSRRYVGYWLTTETKDHVRSLITPAVTSGPTIEPTEPTAAEQPQAAAA